MNEPLVSIAIITRDRVEGLRKCINSILDNAYKNKEIVIIDSSSLESKQKNKEFLSSINTLVKIVYTDSMPLGFAELRQKSIENTHGEFIVNIDDDASLDKMFIATILKSFELDEKIGIIGGNLINVGFKGENQFKGRGKLGINAKYIVVENPLEAEIFGSSNMSIRKKAFCEAGGYDKFFSGGFEEIDLLLNVKKKGYKVIYEPEARVTHFYCPIRFRPPRRNMEMLRLYLFFKHFMPKNIFDWFKFFILEFCLWIVDASKLFWLSIKLLKAKPIFIKALHHFFVQLYLSLVARLAMPYLIFKAKGTKIK
jgi:GT2 family glycosyltransferase